MLDVTILPILSDNYAYIFKIGETVGIVDPGEAAPIIDYLELNNLKPDYILITHHHFDHVDGIEQIKSKYNCIVIGPTAEQSKIYGIDKRVCETDTLDINGEDVQIIETAGHTMGHICYYFKNSKVLFSGDTLFAMGCGRLFEGTAKDMFHSFKKLRALPNDTTVYCGHEYTIDNAKFCLSVDGDNAALIERAKEVQTIRDNNKPTIPTTMGLEKKTNVFMRCDTAQEFKKYRDLKDNF